MVNGVMHIVAAVLFAVIGIKEGMNIIWMGVACVYLALGIVNLVIHTLKVRKIEKAAKRAEQNQPKNESTKPENKTAAGG